MGNNKIHVGKLMWFFALFLLVLLSRADASERIENPTKIDALHAFQIAFQKVHLPEGSIVTSANVIRKKGAELRIGRKGLSEGTLVDDQIYWEVILHISATPKYHAYIFGALIDAETGLIVD